MPAPQQILNALTGSLGLSALPGFNSQESTLQSCPKPDLSCKVEYAGQDTCCFNYPGGQILQTQFWDADPAIGPDDSWTIHGLWPDHCNGGFDQFCDSGRKYSNISLILVDSGRQDLLDYMNAYWKDFRGDDLNLWSHEWNKHGTCVSTMEPKCYTDYIPQQEVVEYFEKTVEVFQGLPSYKVLSEAGIVPSYTKTYTRAEIEDALSAAHGADVSIRCRNGRLNEIWYYFNVAGPLQTGKFVASAPDGQKSNCPANGITYQPKKHKDPSETSPGTPRPTSPKGPFVGRGNLKVSTMGQGRGCLISRGTWYTSGTCADFKKEKVTDDTFTLKSSKGYCAIKKDIFTCRHDIRTPDVFGIEDGKLSFRGNTSFFADKAPKGHTQSKVFASQEDHIIELSMTWHGA